MSVTRDKEITRRAQSNNDPNRWNVTNSSVWETSISSKRSMRSNYWIDNQARLKNIVEGTKTLMSETITTTSAG